MPPSDPNFVNAPADEWTPVVVDAVSVVINILEAFADLVYYQTYRLSGQPAPDNTANPGDVDFEGIAIFNRRDRIAGKDVFVGGVEFQTTAGIDVYIYALEKAGKVRVDSLAVGNGGGGAEWGGITGTLSDQIDLQTDLDGKKNTFSENTAFNKNFGTGAGQVAEGNALAAKMTGPGSSQINEIFVAVDANGNAKTVPVKIDPGNLRMSGLEQLELKFFLVLGRANTISWREDGLQSGALSGDMFINTAGLFKLRHTAAQLTSIEANHVQLKVIPTVESSSFGTGSFVVNGGAGIAKNLNIGGDLGVIGDINTIAWTDYGGTSIITGFSSVTTVAIWYKKVGKLVYVNYVIFGASNSANFTFTLPFPSSNSIQYITRTAAQVRNNGSVQANSGHAKLLSNSNIVNLYLDWAESAFSAAGGKGAEGQFWYETT